MLHADILVVVLITTAKSLPQKYDEPSLGNGGHHPVYKAPKFAAPKFS
jgi:hypothetical protein